MTDSKSKLGCTMRLKNIYFGSLMVGLFLHTAGFSTPEQLAQANKLFQMREQGVNFIVAAKSLYLEIISSSSDELAHRLEALDKFARLSIYQGELKKSTFKISDDQAVDIFNECIEATNFLRPEAIDAETPQYYYLRASCIGLWAANLGKAQFIHKKNRKRLDELQELVEVGLDKFRSHDGFGFNRIKVGILVRSKILKAAGLYNPSLALELIDEAIKNSPQVYINYLLKADVLLELKEVKEARVTLIKILAILDKAINDNTIPQEIAPEGRVFLTRVKDLLGKI
jgi:hypothetical protein